jgi:NADH dehydrogenase
MPAHVFISGGSGFVGSAVIAELLARGCRVSALAHRGNVQQSDSVRVTRGEVFDSIVLNEAIAGCDAAIHLIGIIMERPRAGVTFERMHVEATRAVIEAAKRAGIRRFIHMSALGARPDAPAAYHRTKFAAERLVRESGLDWTIFRPSLIHGPGGFMAMEAGWAQHRSPPFIGMPYFGRGVLGLGGSGTIQPIFVGDVARAFVEAIDNPRSMKNQYDLAGPDRFTWPQFHRTATRLLVGKERLMFPMPVWAAKLYAAMGIAPLLGFNRDQVIMSQEDNTAETAPFEADFGWKPRTLSDTVPQYAARLVGSH